MNTLHNKTVNIRPFQRANRYISIGKVIGNILLKIKKARMRRQTVLALQSLTDAQLVDIGIARYDIRRAVYSSMQRKQKAEFVIGAQYPAYSIRREFRHADNNERIAA